METSVSSGHQLHAACATSCTVKLLHSVAVLYRWNRYSLPRRS